MRYALATLVLAACAVDQNNGSDIIPTKRIALAKYVWESTVDNPRTPGTAVAQGIALASDGSAAIALSAKENDDALAFLYTFAKPKAGEAPKATLIATIPDYVHSVAAGKTVIYVTSTFNGTNGDKLTAYSRADGKKLWDRQLCCSTIKIQIVGDDDVAFYLADGFHWFSKDNVERLSFAADTPLLFFAWRAPLLRADGWSVIPWYSRTATSSIRTCKNMVCTTHSADSALVSDPLELEADGTFALVSEELRYAGAGTLERTNNFSLRRFAPDMTQLPSASVKPNYFTPVLAGDRIVMLTNECRLLVHKKDGRYGFEEPAAKTIVPDACKDELAAIGRQVMQVSGDKLYVLREYDRRSPLYDDGQVAEGSYNRNWWVSVFDSKDLTVKAKDYWIGELNRLPNAFRPSLLSVDGDTLLIEDSGRLKMLQLVEEDVPLRIK